MTNQRKFGTGNYWYNQLATGTGSVVTLGLKLPGCKIAGRIEREHDVASRELMGRSRKLDSSEGYYEGMTQPEDPFASPVFQWRHVVEAIQANSGGRTVSFVLIIESSRASMRTEVAHPITPKRGSGGDALCVVGVARTTNDTGDSTTPVEGRGHTRNTTVHSSGETHSRKGRRS